MSLFLAACESYLKGWEAQSEQQKEEEAKECRDVHPRGINLMIIAKTELSDGTFSPGKKFEKRATFYVTFKQLVEEFLSGECPVSTYNNVSRIVDEYEPDKALVWLFMLVDVEKGGGVAESAMYTTPICERYREVVVDTHLPAYSF